MSGDLAERIAKLERQVQAMAVVVASVEMAVESEGLGEHSKRDRVMDLSRNMEAAFGWCEQDAEGRWTLTDAYPFTWDLE